MNDFQKNIDNGIAAMKKSNYPDAIYYLLEAKKFNNENIRVYRLLGNCLRVVGRVDEAVAIYQEGLTHVYHSGTHERLLNCLNYTDMPQEYIALEHKRWAEKFQKKYDSTKFHHHRGNRNSKKIRLGYVSADFRSHPVSYFLLPIFRNHNKEKFDVICYYNGDTTDGVTRQFMMYAEEWNDIHNVPVNHLYKKVTREKIDILIDLSGHTSGNRLDLFSLKPVDVQVSYLGYPNTTGLSTIDYRIVDSVTDQEATSGSWYSEKLYRMKNCFLCFEPPKEKLDVQRVSKRGSDIVTFGSFNKISKLTDRAIKLWVSIMMQVPDSKILLKSPGFDSLDVRERIIGKFLSAGLDDSERVLLREQTKSRTEHMLMYNEIDIALDSFPYNGTTTTFQALYMSVPVVTLQGKSHISRVSSSILYSLKLNKLIATTDDEYVSKAVNLANDVEQLFEYKSTLRSLLMNSNLVDGAVFTAELEEFYQSIA